MFSGQLAPSCGPSLVRTVEVEVLSTVRLARPRTFGLDDIYVDILTRSQLRHIHTALNAALAARRADLWPSTVAAAGQGPNSGSVVAGLQSRLVLVPLERLGAAQGFSGASVLIGYFMDDSRTYLPSKPLVIKLDQREKLEHELANSRSWPRHPFDDNSRFAHPFWLQALRAEADSAAVLIAPFASEGALNLRQAGWHLRLNDLWQMLTAKAEPPTAKIGRHFRDLYELMYQVHRDGHVRCSSRRVTYKDEYGKYLRGLEDPMALIPKALFGHESVTRLLGEEWPNPGIVVRKVLDLTEFSACCGPVHGDLHPKNVVVDRSLRVNVIDYGWASRSGHIIKDYVLMEANLRAITLSSVVDYKLVRALADCLTPSAPEILATGPIGFRESTIRSCLWKQVLQHRLVSDWDREYIIPLFLVMFGLLKHMDDARNQSSLLLTVLSLARHVDRRLFGA